MPPDNPSRRVDIMDVEDLVGKGLVSLCRCYASQKFPFCDGSHNKHNTANLDNAGPVVVKKDLPADVQAKLLVPAQTSEAELAKKSDKRADNYGIVSNMPPDNPSRRVDLIDSDQLRKLVEEKGVVSLCRCYASKKFPFCDGSHNKHNELTGDNAGPLVIKEFSSEHKNKKIKTEHKEAPNVSDLPTLTMDEVAKHNTEADMWVVIHGKVVDVTKFLPEHPGGVAILKQYAGTVADEGFDGVHNDSVITENLPPECIKGIVEVSKGAVKQEVKRPDIDRCLNLYDFEAVAHHVLKTSSFNYYATASTDEFTKKGNQGIYRRIKLVPRVMVDVSEVNMSTSMLGVPLDFPVYISGAAKCGFAHPEAEVALCRAAHAQGIVQMCPHMSTKTHAEMAEARAAGQTQFLQLYMEKDRTAAKRVVQNADQLGFSAIFLTVDSAGIGKRERDLRSTPGGSAPRSAATARRWADDMTWKDIPWLRSFTKMKIVLKGVQSGADAVLAYQAGVEGIVVSNHGGRNCDTARPSLEVLVEVMQALKAANYDPTRFEVYIDGGIYRGSDVFKALALGATAVGIGRAALFGLAAFGQRGVERTLEILRNELFTVMQMCGKPSVHDIKADSLVGVQEAISAAAWDVANANPTTIQFD
eukprot:CAMPEP_0175149598 /NCGR_PEP_ID=MMETSP0087-20121206/17338_1 /TAXON_ID=136419 /ORGANISM="Unknown Unknown, Strain D1" /LENGTH=642 /DNA_ID=CAMNT_0016435319 /DNA_START=106 /DNA_END=2034 /DNA_ORIENTATION=-